MRKNVIYYMIFVLISSTLLFLSGYAPGWGREAVYVLAYALPLLIGYIYSRRAKRAREDERGISEGDPRLFRLGFRRLFRLLPLLLPTVGTVFLVSYLSSLLRSALGGVGAVPEGSFAELFVSSVLAPSVLEELVFRYLPMLLILPYSKRCAIIISALCFAIIHNPWDMVYAFVAGLLFIVIDIAFESVLPSLLLHFVNNLSSLVWVSFFAGTERDWLFVLGLSLGACVSVLFILVFRKKYCEIFRSCLSDTSYNER